ncbi:trichoplein keratin filament-binding protein-like [Physella acuta]|uniref:trichoplein keratin filament-binding protein-like n=1 Tax=Physella acuta TaxID=109671 RepID=UPI0027DB2EFE|nr:trichoplein keratin filament-binding protein-like [Physella acuta]XP_059146316.1 trichoplein keratin filament-binding protein-like [Physella acuta]XP_059146318.1 trichoplein keratin filament-binding protein-like [Physella acuta]
MALPTMQGYWSSRKNMYEQAIVRHRNHEDNFRNQWTHTANYFKNSDVWAAKQNSWSSSQGFQESMEAYRESKNQDKKALELKARKDKLSLLLAEENKAYEAELKGYSKSNHERLEEMKVKAEGLKSAREEKRQKIAEEKLYQHWRENNPALRKAESALLQEHVVGEWGDQVAEKEERLESARREKLAIEQQMEEERLAAIELERRKEERRLQEEKSIKNILREQMIEFKAREAEAKAWKEQQDLLLREKWELQQLEDQQKRREEERRKKDIGRALLRQHKAQMMHKSKVIQEELEQDRKLLESLIEKENEQTALQTARKEKARADAQWMKQVIDDQLRLEKAREAELDMLYQDEAARMWQKRAAEWERERQARQRLMSEVLESRQEQIAQKLEELQQQQEESLQRREELVREMEIAQQMTRREEEKQKQNKQATKEELEEQMHTRRLKERELQENLRLELEEDKNEEMYYEDLLKQETERMRLKGYTPRDHGRRQAWM